jgi:hypothetical protein
MPNATVRADAQALPHPPTDTIASEAPASPKSAIDDEYLRLMAEEIVASARLSVATEKRKAEKDKAAAAKAEEPKLEASRAFAQAFHAWLAARAGIEDPSLLEGEEQDERFRANSEAERHLFTTPSVYPDQLWQKLEAFESLLNNELMSGQRRDSVLLLAFGSVKQDIVNLDLLEAIR